ncbi:MAG: 1-acyl-sn-glycerol-3-phosphate acyltransferase [Rubrobacteraceae bacterium]
MIDEARNLLYHSPFFEPFSAEDLDYLANNARIETRREGDLLFEEDAPADALFMLLSGGIRLSFRPSSADADYIPVRDVVDPGYPIGWSVMVDPYRYHARATTLEETRVLVFDREVLTSRAEERPAFGVELMQRIMWVVGRRLRETRIRLVARRYAEETTAIRALLDQNAERLHVDSPLHRIPFYLEHRLTLSDAFDTLEHLRVEGAERERDLAELCLEILGNLREELAIYQHVQRLYELAFNAPEDMTPEEINDRTAEEFVKLFSSTDHQIVGEENLPEEPGNIFILNHLCTNADYLLPNGYRLAFDTNFVGSMLVYRKYGVAPVRVVRRSYSSEFGHKQYYDHLNFLYVKTRIQDPEERRRAREEFFGRARATLMAGNNLIICPEGACSYTEKSPLPFKSGTFRLAANMDPEPRIVPVAVANFDKKVSSSTRVAIVHEPFRVSERVSSAADEQEIFAFTDDLYQQYRHYVREAVELANARQKA